MSQSASVKSIDAIRDFRAAVVEFAQEARSALVDIDLEVRRSQEWIRETQPAYWQNEVRKSYDAINDAKQELHRARMRTLPGGETPSCMEEKKVVDRAQRRLAHAQEKLERTREWARAQQHEVAEYEGRAMQLGNLLDGMVPKAMAFLDHAVIHLESYVAAGQSAGAGPTSVVSLPLEDTGETPNTESPPVRGAAAADSSWQGGGSPPPAASASEHPA